MHPTLSKCAVLAALLTLAGCGGAPSDDDVRAALNKQLVGVGGSMASDMYKEQLAKVKLIGCKKADAGGFQCDFANGAGGAGSGRFIKSDAGWVMVGQGG